MSTLHNQGKIFVYAGCWTVQAKGVKGGGIGIYTYDRDSGRLTFSEAVRPDLTAGKTLVDPVRGVLYVVDEVKDNSLFGGLGGGGRIAAFHIDRQTGALSQLGEERSSLGTQPLYLALDGTRNYLVVSNHGDKSAITKVYRDENGKYHVTNDFSPVTAALFPLRPDGSLGEASDLISFSYDRSKVPAISPCLHFVGFAADGEHFLMTNMKQDMVLLYALDRVRGTFRECDRIQMEPGSFPHYAVNHPKHGVFYINCEHAHRIYTVRMAGERLEQIQALDVPPALQHDMMGKKVMQTDILLTPDGKYVYDLFRGTNSVRIFSVSKQDGKLMPCGEYSVGIDGNPRGGAVSPDGKFLLMVDNDNHVIRSLRIAEDGSLTEASVTGMELKFPGNLCFFEA